MREMKDSGVEWIDKIPKEWKIAPLKTLFSFGKGLPITKDNLTESGIAVISYGQIHAKWNSGVTTHRELFRFVGKEYLDTNATSLVKKGDFILADTSEDKDGCGNCAYIDKDEMIFAGYHTIILRSLCGSENRYFAYLFLTDSWRSQIRKAVSGVKLFSISKRILASCSVIVPDNFQNIVTFLDKKITQIDALIANQQTQIEKLKAYKQSLITEVVTKGLDPDVPMKDSGVEWIGMIPEHWEVLKFKHIATVKSNLVDPSQYLDYPQVSPENIEKGSGKLLECKTVRDIGVESNNHLFYRGQILYSKVRPILNKVTIAPFDGLCSADMYPIETAINKKYLIYLMLSNVFLAQIKLVTENRVKMPKINQDEISRIIVCSPSCTDQEAIAKFLDNSCSKIDRLISLKQAKIEKLEQYKKSLIYEYVTGKKEVF